MLALVSKGEGYFSSFGKGVVMPRPHYKKRGYYYDNQLNFNIFHQHYSFLPSFQIKHFRLAAVSPKIRSI